MSPIFTDASELLKQSEYKSLSTFQKIEAVKAYKQFAEEFSKTEAKTDYEEISFLKWELGFIEEAFAAGKFDCFYGGWPSVKKSHVVGGKKKFFCSSPTKSNPNYKKLSKSCGAKQMLCRPALFGKNHCVSVKTQSQRSSAYSQCQRKFNESSKSIADIVEEDHAQEFEALAELVSEVCGSGFQSTTGMCTSLKYRVSQIMGKASKLSVAREESEEESESKSKELIKVVEAVTQGNDEVKKINSSSSSAPLVKVECAETPEVEELSEVYTGYSSSEPIDQSKATPDDYCSGGQMGFSKATYDGSIIEKSEEDVSVKVRYQGKLMDYKNSTPGGYSVTASKLGAPSTTLVKGQVPEDEKAPIYIDRTFSNLYQGRGKENTFEVIDAPIKEVYTDGKLNKRYVSTDFKRIQYSFFPRKVVPSIKARGKDLVMKMTTGEEIVVHAKTGKIISGVGKEVPWSKNVVTKVKNSKEKQVMTYIDNEFSYEGQGIYIQSVQHPEVNEKDTGSVVPVRAKVNGELQECKLKSEDLWELKSGHYLPESDKDFDKSKWACHKFKFEKDQDLYDLIKKTCSNFKFPALIK